MFDRVEELPRAVLGRFHPVVAPALVAVGAAAGVAYLYAVNPHEGGHYPTCPTLALAGLYCPGCGTLRAIHDLSHGDLSGAWGMNPLLVLAVPWLLWRLSRWFLIATGRPLPRRLAPAWSLYLLAGAVMLYGIARNIPFFAPFLAP